MDKPEEMKNSQEEVKEVKEIKVSVMDTLISFTEEMKSNKLVSVLTMASTNKRTYISANGNLNSIQQGLLATMLNNKELYDLFSDTIRLYENIKAKEVETKLEGDKTIPLNPDKIEKKDE